MKKIAILTAVALAALNLQADSFTIETRTNQSVVTITNQTVVARVPAFPLAHATFDGIAATAQANGVSASSAARSDTLKAFAITPYDANAGVYWLFIKRPLNPALTNQFQIMSEALPLRPAQLVEYIGLVGNLVQPRGGAVTLGNFNGATGFNTGTNWWCQITLKN
ncbi:MAG: hypothetical protein WCH99_04805 [Verrucomicrobiota bacterium]